MGVEISFSQRYYWLDSWILANILQLATQEFCDRYIDYRMDPGRRLYDQMVMAARCGVANIAEGSARHSTSIETEMRLLDVARASFDELQGDLFNFLLRRRVDIWGVGQLERETIWGIRLDRPNYSTSYLRDAARHILAQKKKFDPWLQLSDSGVVANAMLILCQRVNRMLQSQLEHRHENFKDHGGFTENMTADRLQARRAQASMEGAPTCPECGKPMLKRMTKKGEGQGRVFWGCSDFPRCRGLRPLEPGDIGKS